MAALIAAENTKYITLCMYHFDGLLQKRRNSSVLAMELRLFCINPRFIESYVTHNIGKWCLKKSLYVD